MLSNINARVDNSLLLQLLAGFIIKPNMLSLFLRARNDRGCTSKQWLCIGIAYACVSVYRPGDSVRSTKQSLGANLVQYPNHVCASPVQYPNHVATTSRQQALRRQSPDLAETDRHVPLSSNQLQVVSDSVKRDAEPL